MSGLSELLTLQRHLTKLQSYKQKFGMLLDNEYL